LRHSQELPLTSVRAATLASVVAFATLMTQVLVHRMVTAKLLNNFAFVVISLTMLGFAASGVLLTRRQAQAAAAPESSIAGWAGSFVLSLLAVSIGLYHAPADLMANSRLEFVLKLLAFVPGALALAVPFTFCGLILGTLLAAPTLEARRVYGADLVGSAAGALLVLPAVARLGVETSLLATSTLLLVACIILAPPRGRLARVVCAAAALSLALTATTKNVAFDLQYPKGTNLFDIVRLSAPFGIETVVWDPVSRIEVSRVPPPEPGRVAFPSLFGTNRAFLARFERLFTQNNFAFTFAVNYDGRRESLRGIEETIYSAAYQAATVAKPRVLVIGVGGGFDILNALAFDASDVVGVDVNAATLHLLRDTYRDYFHSWVSDPRVHLEHDEGRHFLATHDGRYDVLQLSGVDSYAGTPAAAHVFSENYLYTEQAFDLYLSRLSERGVLNMMRLELDPPREMVRALATAVAALRRAGSLRPADNVVVLRERTGRFVAMLVMRTPFPPEAVQRLALWAEQNPYIELAAAPLTPPARPNLYAEFLSLGSPGLEASYLAAIPFDVFPVGDDRPFFFRFSRWSHLFSAQPAVRASLPAMELSLLVLLTVLMGASILAVVLPLRLLAARGRRVRSAFRLGVFFAGIGLGYLAIEIGFLQKFGLFLGHPNYALSVVLAVMLLATGLGALASGWILTRLGNLRHVAYALAVLMLAETLVALPHLMSLLGLSFGARVAVVCGLVGPVGVLLGVFFPSALEALKPSAPAFVPWAWGLNGMASVMAPVLSVAFSMTWGVDALLLSAVPAYLVAALCFPEAIP
jgi:hypothetical protein